MNGWTLSRYGEPATLELRDWPDPVPASAEVQIRIRAASINPIDYKLMRGDLKRIHRVRFSQISGFDQTDVTEAIAHSMDGHTRGKIVVEGLA